MTEGLENSLWVFAGAAAAWMGRALARWYDSYNNKGKCGNSGCTKKARKTYKQRFPNGAVLTRYYCRQCIERAELGEWDLSYGDARHRMCA